MPSLYRLDVISLSYTFGSTYRKWELFGFQIGIFSNIYFYIEKSNHWHSKSDSRAISFWISLLLTVAQIDSFTQV